MYGGVKNEPLLSLVYTTSFSMYVLYLVSWGACYALAVHTPKTFYSVLSKSLVIEQRSVAVPHPTVYYYTIILRIYVVYGSSSSRAAKSLRKGRIKEQSAAKLLRSAVLSLFFFFNFSWWAVSVAGTLLTLLNILWISNFDSVFGKRQNI